MDDSIILGGNIELEGFSVLDPAELLIVKKLVGAYIRKVCDAYNECERAHFLLSKKEELYIVSVEVLAKERFLEQSEGSNVFVTLDNALKKILKKLKIEDV